MRIKNTKITLYQDEVATFIKSSEILTKIENSLGNTKKLQGIKKSYTNKQINIAKQIIEDIAVNHLDIIED